MSIYIITKLAVPKKAKKPTTSVTVVKITEPASAGSNLNLSNVIGISTPNRAAVIIFTIMASEMVAPNANDWNHAPARAPMIKDHNKPLIEPIPNSF